MTTPLRWSFIALAAAALLGQNANRSGIHNEDMDTACKPCTDFWRYVNGAWLDKNPIPSRSSSWGAFSVLSEANDERTRTILEAAASDRSAPPGSNQRKMGDLYASCMDTQAIDARGISPLQPEFHRIAAVHSLKELGALLAQFQRTGRPFGLANGVVVGAFRVQQRIDPKNPSRVIATIVERDVAGRTGTSIFSLPDRDYYFKDDPKSREVREAFVKHVARMLQLAGSSPATAEAEAGVVLKFETSLAESTMTLAEKRDPEKTYHLMDLAGLQTLAPNFDWIQLFRELHLSESTPVIVTEPELIRKFNRMLTEVSLNDWKTWLRWRSLQIAAPYLANSFGQEDFHFERGVLAGVREQRPRWQTCANLVDRDFSDALGAAWVAKYFPPEAKRRMSLLVENLRGAMRDELEHSEWMLPETRKNAIRKLEALRIKIGYPDQWRDYSALHFDRSRFFENVRAAWVDARRYELAKIGKPVNRTDWGMTPPTVNAYSSAAQVEIVFPAGILQPPFFDMQADDAANYGGIGVVIGHEMGHQFDDTGSKYDWTGALRNWWTEDDRAKFDARTACVVDQFNTLDVGGGRHHNGKQVLGEALGDLGGISVAYRAYQRSLGGNPGPVMDGFTADQRFFIAFARTEGTQYRPEAALLQLNTNNHPLSQYRAIATLQNMSEFHRAFQCKPGDPMVRPSGRQCKLW